ncbi:Interferon alpha-inducible protein 6/27 [Phytophthora cactorum]|nr:Interferon alpha-inducible protein 6/27 [Phytophthora cactorum]
MEAICSSGSAVAIMQSIGAVGLVTPIGLGLVAGGAVIGGAAFLMKSHLSNIPSAETDTAGTEAKDEEKGLWVLVEMSPDSVVCTFDDEYKARNAFLNSSATSKALFDPEEKIVLEIDLGAPLSDLIVFSEIYVRVNPLIGSPARRSIDFTSGGITAGSTAAGMMSSATIANGGGVAAGSLVAKKGLQSIGAAGLAATTDPLLVGAGAVAVWAM